MGLIGEDEYKKYLPKWWMEHTLHLAKVWPEIIDIYVLNVVHNR
jgi:hypothetical protein